MLVEVEDLKYDQAIHHHPIVINRYQMPRCCVGFGAAWFSSTGEVCHDDHQTLQEQRSSTFNSLRSLG